MDTFSEKTDDLKDFIQYAENNFAIVIYDTKQVQQIILYHLKAIDEYVKFIDFSRCHQRAYAERFKAQLTKSEKITSYVLKNLEEIIPKVKEEQNEWANLFNFSREDLSDGVRNTVFLVSQATEELLFHQAKDIYRWFVFRRYFSEKDALSAIMSGQMNKIINL
ncbi:MAG: hypothetical protein GY795_05370 [Desulfobacterales bacterium]|nr:hypothetical protein [Desulfobacterales bacterium]